MSACRSFSICVPARNEAERLPVLLAALAAQDVEGPLTVFVCLNNTSDGSVSVVDRCARHYRGRLVVHTEDVTFSASQAHAGSARRRVMDTAYAKLGNEPQSVLISTDADARPPPSWVSGNLAAIEDGADIVGGHLLIDEREAVPSEVMSLRLMWDRYWRRVRDIEDAIDPRACDPRPRHGDHTGASLALTTEIYRRAGGVPELAHGEDRALVANAVAAGGVLVHPLNVWTRVSPRLDGRAAGGMAQAMADLHEVALSGQTPLAPALSHWQVRARWRRNVRLTAGGDAAVAHAERGLPPLPCDTPIDMIVEHP